MKRLLAVEHIQILVILLVAFTPALAVLFWLLTGRGGGVGEVVTLAAAVVTCWAIGAWVVLQAMRPQRYLEELAELEAGGGWARWSYDGAQWAAAVAVERGRLWRLYRPSAIALGAVTGVALVIALFTAASAVPAVLALAAFVVAAAALVLWLGGGGPAARRARAGEVLVGRLGVLRRPGAYTVFAPAGRLTGVELLSGRSARVVFTTTRRTRGRVLVREQTADLREQGRALLREQGRALADAVVVDHAERVTRTTGC